MVTHAHKYRKITLEKANGEIVVFDLTDPTSEPVFLLRGQDKFASLTVVHYASILRSAAKSGPDSGEAMHEQADHALQHAHEMDNWPNKKTPD